ncbi:hypothetical protein [Terasakiella sp.]|uniref:hypothetical protein n=1 Tax=Terasakiella sp. TaxID=2034861 RepID=UPI003AA839BF
MLNKIFLGAGLALVAVCAALLWWGSSKAEQAAKWEQAHSKLQKVNAEWQTRFDEKTAELARVSVISTEREIRRQSLVNEAESLRQKLRSLSRHDQNVSDYLVRPIPVGLLDSLQQYAAPDAGPTASEAIPARPLAVELPGPGGAGKSD